MKYEYLLIKRNGNKDGLIYDKIFFNNSANARKEFRKDDILLKCKTNSIYHEGFSWTVKEEDVVKNTKNNKYPDLGKSQNCQTKEREELIMYRKFKPSKSAKREFARKMDEIREFCDDNCISYSNSMDSFYFTIGCQHYRVSQWIAFISRLAVNITELAITVSKVAMQEHMIGKETRSEISITKMAEKMTQYTYMQAKQE